MATNLGPIMSKMLDRYGLGELGSWLSQRITAGASPEQIELELYDRPEFIKRFPAIRIRGRDGLPPLSVDEYLAYEAQATTIARAYGVSISQSQINDLLAGNVSMAEAQDRLDLASRAALQSDSKTRAELNRIYGVTTGDLINFWLDPKETSVGLQRKFATAQISGEAKRAGFDQDLSRGQLGYLVNRGMTPDQATSAFGQLVESEELFQSTDVTEDEIGIDDQLSILTGDQNLTEKVERRGERRFARFQEGGAFSTGRSGVAGLGSANT